jgi:hypothetical protein
MTKGNNPSLSEDGIFSTKHGSVPVTDEPQEQKATLEASYSEYDFITTFDFTFPVSGDYEVDLSMDEDVRHADEYLRECSSNAKMKYSQGNLEIHIECDERQSFTLKVKDAEHTYKASCYGGSDFEENITTEGIGVFIVDEEGYIVEDDEESNG